MKRLAETTNRFFFAFFKIRVTCVIRVPIQFYLFFLVMYQPHQAIPNHTFAPARRVKYGEHRASCESYLGLAFVFYSILPIPYFSIQ